MVTLKEKLLALKLFLLRRKKQKQVQSAVERGEHTIQGRRFEAAGRPIGQQRPGIKPKRPI